MNERLHIDSKVIRNMLNSGQNGHKLIITLSKKFPPFLFLQYFTLFICQDGRNPIVNFPPNSSEIQVQCMTYKLVYSNINGA